MKYLQVALDGLLHPTVNRIISPSLLFLIAIIESMPPAALNKLGPSLFTKIINFHKNNLLVWNFKFFYFGVIFVKFCMEELKDDFSVLLIKINIYKTAWHYE